MSYPTTSACTDPRLFKDQNSYQLPAPDKQRRVDAAFARLDEHIGALSKVISDFESKLAPYLRAEPPSKAAGVENTTPTLDSRVVNKIDAVSMDIDNTRSFLSSLIERID